VFFSERKALVISVSSSLKGIPIQRCSRIIFCKREKRCGVPFSNLFVDELSVRGAVDSGPLI
jgi:hypothetical protein